ncbi:Melibiase [Mariniphaga anaerophila]|uniref:Melibiase n=1 Tax=Mariniphaga anaerophila TaxID=1484053 RepID=A0A1M4YZV5_9BACT|nr:glycoside hydrolase family 36 protein [Mariniphaga anaerophila]SHF11363.1 Melibiase [Mariniphaga anaerophila]
MKRRKFIQSCSLATTQAILLPEIILIEQAKTPFVPVTGSWKLHKNGSFDLISSKISLKDSFPSFNGKPVRPIKIDVEPDSNGGRIIYTLTKGKIILILNKKRDRLTLDSSLEGFNTAPHWFLPMSGSTIIGANRYFKQGNGFGGPSGVFQYSMPPQKREYPHNNESWSIDSYLSTGFIAPDGETIAVAPFHFDKYVCRSTHHNKNYRKGLIDRHLDYNINLFEIGFATENIPLGSSELALPTVNFFMGETAYPTFRKLAKEIGQANGIKRDKKTVYGWCSWYEFEHNFNQLILKETIEGLKTLTPSIPLEMIQIDDGYSVHGDWVTSNRNFPDGLEYAAKIITDNGYNAGIWIGPFMVMKTSEVFKNHQDWLLRNTDGELIRAGTFRGVDDYILDTSHPDAFNHLRHVFRKLRSYGFSYFKTDFLDWGLNDSTSVKRYKTGKTSAQYFIDVMKMIREEIGNESYWLGCIAPYEQMVGYANGMRYSNDVTGMPGAISNLIPETVACQYMNGTLFLNDPDTVFLRDYNETKHLSAQDVTGFSPSIEVMNTDEKVSLALWNGMTSNCIVTSDRVHLVNDNMQSLFRFLQPGSKFLPTTHLNWEHPAEIKNALRHLPNGDYAFLLFNTSENEQKKDITIGEIVPFDSAFVFRWGHNLSHFLGKLSSLSVKLKKNQAMLLYLSQSNQQIPKGMKLFG